MTKDCLRWQQWGIPAIALAALALIGSVYWRSASGKWPASNSTRLPIPPRVFQFGPASGKPAREDLNALVDQLCWTEPWYVRVADKGLLGIGRFVPDRIRFSAHIRQLEVSSRRDYAAHVLTLFGTNAWPVLPELCDALDGSNTEISLRAGSVLGAIQADDSPAFAKLARRWVNHKRPTEIFSYLLAGRDQFTRPYDAEIRRFALIGLTYCGGAATAALPILTDIVAHPSDEDHQNRALAIGVLGNAGPAASVAVPQFERLLKDTSEWPDVRGAAALALARVARQAPQTAVLLRVALRDEHSLVRIEAAHGLWRIGAPAQEILPVLTNGLALKLAAARIASLEALGAMGTAARPASAAAQALLRDPRPQVRQAAKRALQKIDPVK